MRILVCGDRNWTDVNAIRRELSKLPPGSIIIEGECPRRWDRVRHCWASADFLARTVAEELGFQVIPFKAAWKTHGKAAGPIRNRQMLREGKPDEVWAFHANLVKSRGTKDMSEAAEEAGVMVRRFEK